MLSSDRGTGIVIHQFRPAYGLQAMCRWAKIPFTVVNSSYPSYSSVGMLPALHDGSTLLGYSHALEYLKEKTNFNASLSPDNLVRCEALSAIVLGILEDVALWCHYGDEERFEKVTAPSMRHAMLAPLKWIVPSMVKKEAQTYLHRKRFLSRDWVERQAKDAYRVLAEALSTSWGDYFFGSVPSTLDVLIYGHMAEVRTLPAGSWIKEVASPLLYHFSCVRNAIWKDALRHEEQLRELVRKAEEEGEDGSVPENFPRSLLSPIPPIRPKDEGQISENVFEVIEREVTFNDIIGVDLEEKQGVWSHWGFSKTDEEKKSDSSKIDTSKIQSRGALPFGETTGKNSTRISSLIAARDMERSGPMVELLASAVIFSAAGVAIKALIGR